MEKGDVVTVMTSIGEYIARFEGMASNGVTVTDPRLIVSNPQTQEIGFGRGVCMSAVENVDRVTFGDIIFVTPTNDKFTKAWREAVSGIIT